MWVWLCLQGSELLEKVLIPIAEELNLPIALKLGAHRGVNPLLRTGGVSQPLEPETHAQPHLHVHAPLHIIFPVLDPQFTERAAMAHVALIDEWCAMAKTNGGGCFVCTWLWCRMGWWWRMWETCAGSVPTIPSTSTA